MIKAGNHTISDKGFTVVTENIGGVPRQAVVAELPGGISDEALAAFCAGPIEVLAEDGSTTATYTGPFRVVSHGLKLTRTSEDSDVAALTAQVAELEAKLSHEKSEKESAQSALARLNEQLTTLKMTLEANSADKAVVDKAPVEDWAEASCLISNLLAELEQPCRICREDSLVLTGRSPTGETVTIRLGPDLVLEAEGCDELLDAARKRGCPDG